jgi:predicted ATPase
MVSELAPIVLFLKNTVNPRDLLIIEEPESHLHPASQLRFAKALAGLVKADVKILLTTHSDYFLTQISNFIRAANIREEAHHDLPTLKAADVGTYLFNATDNGTEVKELPITENDGIPDDSFAEIAEALYKERITLQA